MSHQEYSNFLRTPHVTGELLAASTREEYGMPQEPVITILSRISASSLGVFRLEHATALGVTPNQLARLTRQGSSNGFIRARTA